MKTPEDEAFDDLAKRQGDWGSGFQAKRKMAADKLFEDQINYGSSWSKNGERIDPASVYLEEPAQEPVAHLWECLGRWSAYLVCNGKQADCAPPSWLVKAIQNATTPPKREWVGLTDADADDLFVETQRHMIGAGSREFTRIFTRLINAKLKEQNND
jgi:hypothetical protein